jgi:hypothetical protein
LEAQSKSFDAKQQAALEETEVDLEGAEAAEAAAKAALEEMALEKAEVALKEAAATQPRSVLDANPSAQAPQTSPEEAGVVVEDAGKDTAGAIPQADGADGTVAEAKKQAERQLLEDRSLDDPKLYKKVGNEYYLRFEDRWIPSLNGEYWAALVALHRALLHEQHDFFLASQHPRASPALRRLASKYVLPTRMWRHGIRAFLEVLLRRLPDCQEFMWTFIYLSYSMLALLDETIPQFRHTWVECKADLARYR